MSDSEKVTEEIGDQLKSVLNRIMGSNPLSVLRYATGKSRKKLLRKYKKKKKLAKDIQESLEGGRLKYEGPGIEWTGKKTEENETIPLYLKFNRVTGIVRLGDDNDGFKLNGFKHYSGPLGIPELGESQKRVLKEFLETTPGKEYFQAEKEKIEKEIKQVETEIRKGTRYRKKVNYDINLSEKQWKPESGKKWTMTTERIEEDGVHKLREKVSQLMSQKEKIRKLEGILYGFHDHTYTRHNGVLDWVKQGKGYAVTEKDENGNKTTSYLSPSDFDSIWSEYCGIRIDHNKGSIELYTHEEKPGKLLKGENPKPYWTWKGLKQEKSGGVFE